MQSCCKETACKEKEDMTMCLFSWFRMVLNRYEYFKNYARAYEGKEEFMVQIPQARRVLQLMDAIRESACLGKSIDSE